MKPPQLQVKEQQLHVFTDASETAIGHVVYLRTVHMSEEVHVAFVHGDSKVAPRGATTIPRLELSAAVDATLCASKIYHELETKPSIVYFCSDSQIVRSYISNTEKRFTYYVTRRISIILKHSSKEQWMYISTRDNPGDVASRGCTPPELLSSTWLTGPKFLWKTKLEHENFLEENSLPEEKQEKVALQTRTTQPESSTDHLYRRVSGKKKLVNIVKILMRAFHWADEAKRNLGRELAVRNPSPTEDYCMQFLVRDAQKCFHETIVALERHQPLSASHHLSDLAPFLDEMGMLRVGGRLTRSNLAFDCKHPLLLPEQHGLTKCILEHFHSTNGHQGRLITHAVIRKGGYHILNGRRVIRKFLKNCVICQKLRGPFLSQRMADLPQDRLEEVPPFSNVGMDVFGHFFVHDSTGTRRNPALKKIWALIFVCLSSRAVHLEPLTSMDVNSFRNAFSRFVCIRGSCKLIRSDHGSNFICAKRQNRRAIGAKGSAARTRRQQLQVGTQPPGSITLQRMLRTQDRLY